MSTGAVRAISVTLAIAQAGQLDAFGRPAAERRGDLLRHRGLPHDLGIVPSLDRVVDLQHPPGGFVRELQPAVLVDDEDPFDHAREDRRHPRAIRFEPREPGRQIARQRVEHARHAADLVLRRSRGPIGAKLPAA